MSKPQEKKVVSIPINSIHNKFDVRRVIDDDRVLFLAELMVDGVKLEPIQVVDSGNGEYIFVDGRHRAAACQFLGVENIDAVIVKEMPTVQMFSMALKANWGGPKPPTRADIQHTIRRMIDEGVKVSDIRAHLSFIPDSRMKRLIENARSNIAQLHMKQAIAAVADGVAIQKAAETHGIELQALKNAISGKKRKFGAGGDGAVMAEGKAFIGKMMKTSNMNIARRFDILLRRTEDGDVSADTVEKLLDTWEKSTATVLARIKDWRSRLTQVDPQRAGRREDDDIDLPMPTWIAKR